MSALSVEAQVAQLGAAVLAHADNHADTMLALMRREVGFHRAVTLVSDDDLRATVRTHLDFILGALGSATLGFDTRAAAETGRNRAGARGSPGARVGPVPV